MTKLKKLYSNYVARRHCKFTFARASNRTHVNYSVSRIWQMCPLYDEAIIRKYLISLACYAMGISLTVASFVYDEGDADD